jgi:hypothetical protein
MKVSSEFLVIENNKAIVKKLEKQIDTYECLNEFKNNIDEINIDELKKRLNSKFINEKIIIKEIFAQELIDNSFLESLASKEITFKANKSNLSSDEKKIYRAYEMAEMEFSEIDEVAQQILIDNLFQNINDVISRKEREFQKNEEVQFINESLGNPFVVFNEGIKSKEGGTFEYRNLKILKWKNKNSWGDFTNNTIVIKLYNNTIHWYIKNNEYYEYSLIYQTSYSPIIVARILNEYLQDEKEFERKHITNEIRLTKELLIKEENAISRIKNKIIPELEMKLKDKKISKTELDSIKKELEKYTVKRVRHIGYNYSYGEISIEDREVKIELLKEEINRLIDFFKSEENLMNYV